MEVNKMLTKQCNETDMELFAVNPVEFVSKLREEYETMVNVKMNEREFLFVFEPDYIKKILDGHNTSRTRFSKIFARLAGGSLFLTGGEKWRNQRKMFAPFLGKSRIDINAVYNIAEKVVENWHDACKNAEIINARESITLFCMEVLSLIVYGKNEKQETLKYINDNWNLALTYLTEITGQSSENALESIAKFEETCKKIDEAIYEIIDEKINSDEKGNDFLSCLINYENSKNGEKIDRSEIMIQIRGLYLAGFETISGALSWFIYDLSANLDVQEKLRNEIEVFSNNVLDDTGYMKLCFDETLRLHPSLVFVDRKLDEDIDLGNVVLKKGTEVLISPYIVHRDTKYWENPQIYNPERFIAYNSQHNKKYTYFPYGGGHRKCMGGFLSVIERNILMEVILKRFSFELEIDSPVHEDIILVLRPDKVNIKLKELI